VTIYDLLRRLMPGPAWQDYEVREALDLIAELERLNVFGTTARIVTEQHEHDWDTFYPPDTGLWERNPPVAVTRCKICGKDKTRDE